MSVASREAETVLYYPTILLIGAMKAGTTSLFADLVRHPAISGSVDKEPEVLLSMGDRQALAGAYRWQFGRADPGQHRLEASTAYTKSQHAPEAASHAKEHLPPETRILYQVRDPVDRVISHAQHLRRHGRTNATKLRDILDEFPEVIATSRYHACLTPWLEAFPARVHVVCFEEYVSDRSKTLAGIANWLDVDTSKDEWSGPRPKLNQSSGGVGLRTGAVGALRESSFYRILRPWLSHDLRARLGSWFSTQPPPESVEHSAADLMRVREELVEDVAAFFELPEAPYCPWRTSWSHVD